MRDVLGEGVGYRHNPVNDPILAGKLLHASVVIVVFGDKSMLNTCTLDAANNMWVLFNCRTFLLMAPIRLSSACRGAPGNHNDTALESR